jgi:hypothetical protein
LAVALAVARWRRSLALLALRRSLALVMALALAFVALLALLVGAVA